MAIISVANILIKNPVTLNQWLQIKQNICLFLRLVLDMIVPKVVVFQLIVEETETKLI